MTAGLPSSLSLVRRLMVGLMLTIGGASAAASLIFVAYNSHHAELDLEQGADGAVIELAQAVDAPLWDLDMERAGAIADAFAADPHVVRLSITEATTGAAHVIDRGPTADAVTRSRAVVHRGLVIGQVSMSFSRASYKRAMWRQIQVSAIVTLIALVAAFVTVQLLVRRLLQRPLTELSRVVNAYAAGRYETPVGPALYREFQPFGAVLAAMGGQIVQQLADMQAEVRAHQETVESLRRHRNMLAHVMDSVPHSIFWKDRDSVYLGCNSTFARAVGVSSPDDVVGRSDLDLSLPHPIAGTYRADDLEVMDQKRAKQHIVEAIARPDGSTLWADTTKIPLTDDGGRVYGILGITEDVTERRLAEEALRRGNKELGAINAFMRLASADIEPQELLQIACRELVDMFGLRHACAGLADVAGAALEMVAEERPADCPSVVGAKVPLAGNLLWRQLGQRRAPVAIDEPETDVRLGTMASLLAARQVVSLLALPLVIDRAVVGVIVLGSTEPRAFTPEEFALAASLAGQIAQALGRQRAQATERRLRAAIEQTPESVVITDTDGSIVYVNPAFSAITGYSRDEALGQNPRVLKSGEHDAAFYRHLWHTLGAGQVWQGRIKNRKKNGEIFTENAIIAPVRDGRGAVINYLAVKRDITQELALEERYLHAQRMEAVGQLAGGVAHDFNNILSAMIMQVDVMQLGDDLPERITEGLQEVRAAAERAANLTRQLLMFSRRQAMSVRVQDLSAVVMNLLKMLGRVISETITLSFEPAVEPVMFAGDAAMIEQVIMNLCVNARDAMPNGGRLTLATRVVLVDAAEARKHEGARAGLYAVLSVSDTGTGMSDDTLRRVFEPFFTTKGVGKGTGLGLATTHGIVTQHRGWITVESELGAGTAFMVYLPALDRRSDEADAGVDERLWRGEATVLLVEDEPAIRQMTHEALQHLGYAVVTAIHGADALRVWQDHRDRIDLLLTDMVMPEGISGLELSQRLRAQKPDLKVVIVSGYSAELPLDEGPLGRSVVYLAKPYTLARLSDVLRRALGDRAEPSA